MRLRRLEALRCPVCRSNLILEEPDLHRVERVAASKLPACRGLCPFPELTGQCRDCWNCLRYEVMGGFIRCVDCAQRYVIDQGVPRLWYSDCDGSARTKRRTAVSYGYLWRRPAGRAGAGGSLEGMATVG